MFDEIRRIFLYSIEFYLQKILLVVLFSLPFFLAFLIPLFVPAPTYLAAGGLFVRTGSLPEFSIPDIVITVIAYAISLFIIADTVVNINILIRSRRTLNETTAEMAAAIPNHVTKIFVLFTIIMLLHFFFNILLYDAPFQLTVYPLLSFIISFLLFFIAPAIVIDNSDIGTAISHSFYLSTRKPHLVLFWLVFAAILLAFSKVFGDAVFSGVFAQFLVLLLNSVVFLPLLIILQTEMYMEKYPLAR